LVLTPIAEITRDKEASTQEILIIKQALNCIPGFVWLMKIPFDKANVTSS
jgi:hypothetical protein